MSTYITILGILGAVALVSSFGLVSTAKMSGNGLPYQLLNFGGAIALMINSAYHSAWPSAILNMVWSGIGVLTIGRIIASRAGAHRSPGAEPDPIPGFAP